MYLCAYISVCIYACAYLIIHFDLQTTRRQSIPPPSPPKVTWSEYINSPPGKVLHLGRQLVSKQSSKHFKATLAMVCLQLYCFLNS